MASLHQGIVTDAPGCGEKGHRCFHSETFSNISPWTGLAQGQGEYWKSWQTLKKAAEFAALNKSGSWFVYSTKSLWSEQCLILAPVLLPLSCSSQATSLPPFFIPFTEMCMLSGLPVYRISC